MSSGSSLAFQRLSRDTLKKCWSAAPQLTPGGVRCGAKNRLTSPVSLVPFCCCPSSLPVFLCSVAGGVYRWRRWLWQRQWRRRGRRCLRCAASASSFAAPALLILPSQCRRDGATGCAQTTFGDPLSPKKTTSSGDDEEIAPHHSAPTPSLRPPDSGGRTLFGGGRTRWGGGRTLFGGGRTLCGGGRMLFGGGHFPAFGMTLFGCGWHFLAVGGHFSAVRRHFSAVEDTFRRWEDTFPQPADTFPRSADSVPRP
eukprot:gene9656-biopygen12247